jgi:hypothetical protein
MKPLSVWDLDPKRKIRRRGRTRRRENKRIENRLLEMERKRKFRGWIDEENAAKYRHATQIVRPNLEAGRQGEAATPERGARASSAENWPRPIHNADAGDCGHTDALPPLAGPLTPGRRQAP